MKNLTKRELEEIVRSKEKIDVYFYEREAGWVHTEERGGKYVDTDEGDAGYVHTRMARGALLRQPFALEPDKDVMGYSLEFRESSQRAAIYGIFPDKDKSAKLFEIAYLTKEGRDLYIISEEMVNVERRVWRMREKVNPKATLKQHSNAYFPVSRFD